MCGWTMNLSCVTDHYQCMKLIIMYWICLSKLYYDPLDEVMNSILFFPLSHAGFLSVVLVCHQIEILQAFCGRKIKLLYVLTVLWLRISINNSDHVNNHIGRTQWLISVHFYFMDISYRWIFVAAKFSVAALVWITPSRRLTDGIQSVTVRRNIQTFNTL